jgi:hypothetical protein
MNYDNETTVGDPWNVIPIKTRKYAKECIEVVLSNRNVNKLVNFGDFENLEALWLTNNKVTDIFTFSSKVSKTLIKISGLKFYV